MAGLEDTPNKIDAVSTAVLTDRRWYFPIFPRESRDTVETGDRVVTYRSIIFGDDGHATNIKRASFHTGTGDLTMADFNYTSSGRRPLLLNADYTEYVGCRVDTPEDTLSYEITAPEPALRRSTVNLVLTRNRPVRMSDTKFTCEAGSGNYYRIELDAGIVYGVHIDRYGDEHVYSVQKLVSLNQYQSGNRYQLVMAVEQ